MELDVALASGPGGVKKQSLNVVRDEIRCSPHHHTTETTGMHSARWNHHEYGEGTSDVLRISEWNQVTGAIPASPRHQPSQLSFPSKIMIFFPVLTITNFKS